MVIRKTAVCLAKLIFKTRSPYPFILQHVQLYQVSWFLGIKGYENIINVLAPNRIQKIKSFSFLFPEYKEAFAKFNPYRITSLQVAYDYHSIMHYGRKAFSKNGQDTIRPKDKTIYSLGNDRLSELDIKQANLLYQCDGKTLFLTNTQRNNFKL